MKIFDGLINVLSSLTNRRSAMAANVVTHQKLAEVDLRAIFKSGLGSKIVKIKAGYALNNTLKFSSVAHEKYYKNNLRADVLKAAKFMVGFGRGLVVVYQEGDDLSQPWKPDDTRPIKQRVFSADMISISDYSIDFMDDRYYKPQKYIIRGEILHWSRCVDFTYFEPPEFDKPTYRFGGISEFELIYPQLVNDGVVERASGSIVEKNATVFYGVQGFRQALEMGKDKDIIKYFSALEDNRSIYGAGIVDKDDTVIAVDQTMTNLKDVDNITLRRLAMVTGIPLAWLVGENVQGLNATGDNERAIFQDTIESVQLEYLLAPINRLAKMHGLGEIEFKENQGDTPQSRIAYEKDVVTNAFNLWQMGEDHHTYLEQREVLKPDDFEKFFGEPAGKDDDADNERELDNAELAPPVDVIGYVTSET